MRTTGLGRFWCWSGEWCLGLVGGAGGGEEGWRGA